ncbi:hypothetical protein GWK47_019425 [Chionoecetes opilio]|uniref:Uncharacterized protein n=1 Tax=Chionoecetes opilio TaxID=41210 RepID=A0A8J4XS68_CHIOP|nr:hypothetical protein GWK47_019425 [Chionoecetes opilio]
MDGTQGLINIAHSSGMVRMGGTKVKEDQVMLAVEHVQQRHTWDCGLACVNMVLPPSARRKFSSQLYEICEEEGFGKRCE